MGVVSPELLTPVYAERFNAGDAEGLGNLYAENAVFTYDGAEKAVGRAHIVGALRGFMAAGLELRNDLIELHMVDDTALTRVKWRLLETSGAVLANGISVQVQRRGDGGMWRLLLADSGGGSRV